jgi:hypothetical protein
MPGSRVCILRGRQSSQAAILESKTGLMNCSSEANFSWTAAPHARLATKFVSQDNNIETPLALSARTVSDSFAQVHFVL